MSLAERPRHRLAMLCALYLVQGIPTGLVSIGLAAYLAGQGASVNDVARLLAVSWTPWAFKFVYGPLVDRYSGSLMGRRRPWMLAAHGGMAVTLGLIVMTPDLESRLALLGALIFCHNLFSSLQDVSVDALAVDLLEPAERGRASGVMWSAKLGGIALGGAGLGTVMSHAGISTAFGFLLAAVLLAMQLPLLLREQDGDRLFPWSQGTTPRSRSDGFGGLTDLFKNLGSSLRTSRALVVALLALLAALPTRMMITLGPVFAVQRIGWDDATFAQFTGGPALMAGLVGALSGGWLVDRIGFRNVLGLSFAGIVIVFGLFATVERWWRIVGVVESLLLSAVFIDMMLRMSLIALFMHVAVGRTAATQFSGFMALCNLCNVLGSIIIVPLNHYFDYQGIFLVALCFSVLTAPLLLMVPDSRRVVAIAPIGRNLDHERTAA